MTSSDSALDLSSLIDLNLSSLFEDSDNAVESASSDNWRRSEMLFADIENETALDLRTTASKQHSQPQANQRRQCNRKQPNRGRQQQQQQQQQRKPAANPIDKLSLSLAEEESGEARLSLEQAGESTICLTVVLHRCRQAGQQQEQQQQPHSLTIPLSSLARLSANGCQLDIELPSQPDEQQQQQRQKPQKQSSQPVAESPVACIECGLEFNRADLAVAHFRRRTLSGGRHSRYQVLLQCDQPQCGKLFSNYSSRKTHQLREHGAFRSVAGGGNAIKLATYLVGPNSRLYKLAGRRLLDCGPYPADAAEPPRPATITLL